MRQRRAQLSVAGDTSMQVWDQLQGAQELLIKGKQNYLREKKKNGLITDHLNSPCLQTNAIREIRCRDAAFAEANGSAASSRLRVSPSHSVLGCNFQTPWHEAQRHMLLVLWLRFVRRRARRRCYQR
jgi:hypothetical protein